VPQVKGRDPARTLYLQQANRGAVDIMQHVRATAWHGGGSPRLPGGYGIKFTERDRDKYFHPDWTDVVIDLQGGESARVSLSPSFWRSCSELRSALIGRWLLDIGAAPWTHGSPPSIAVDQVARNRFTARVLTRRTLRS
jgi:hypothetical protein